MAHAFQENYPLDWDCGPRGGPMGGNSRLEWSPCSVMNFRRMYNIYQDNWCMEGYTSAVHG